LTVRATRQRTHIQINVTLPLRGGRRMVVPGDQSQSRVNPMLVAALRKAHRFFRRDRKVLPCLEKAPQTAYSARSFAWRFSPPNFSAPFSVAIGRLNSNSKRFSTAKYRSPGPSSAKCLDGRATDDPVIEIK